MPKRTDIKSIAIIGAGPIVIGQACEFDYSGTQACKALRDEGYRVILINSNPATIMTDPALADATYIEPITPEVVAKILEKEKPDAVLPTMGGQTALNTALDLAKDGTLDRLGIELIGAKQEAIELAEDRMLFKETMAKLGLDCPKSVIANNYMEAMEALESVGLPAIIRPSFTLGGTGGGIAYNRNEYELIIRQGLQASPVKQILIEESVLGWKEYEMEVVRDKADNCIIICSIENIDPMGVHTGDSITVAPALTLTDKEYQRMRNASLAVLRGIGIETGGSNVQFAVNPEDGRMTVIEMNPRVSRSSALTSKATGFPIAKVAAKLAVGYTLDELQNDITGAPLRGNQNAGAAGMPAAFEPTIDYVVTKIPRFNFEKFRGTEEHLTTSMKSVGEVMAMGRTFEESLQKALCSMETGLNGLKEINLVPEGDEYHEQHISAALSQPRPDRMLVVAQAFRHGLSVEEVYKHCKFDPWFLARIKNLVDHEEALKKNGLPKNFGAWMATKQLGFSDARIAQLTGKKPEDVTKQRHKAGVRPVYKRVDTCAAEFPSNTSYMYSTYEANGTSLGETEAAPEDTKKVVIIGSGPNRIGQGIEFDYCCVHASYALRERGIQSIMINCNPETVSTDYDTSDRLYFEPVTAEKVLDIVAAESGKGTLLGAIVQLGGQTPLKLCRELEKAGVTILGTSPDAIDLAEDRERFQKLLQKARLKQPANGLARTALEAEKVAQEIGFPVVLRPSYVLGGSGMEIVHDLTGLRRYIGAAVEVSGDAPVLIDQYLQNCIEVDVDALCDGKEVFIAGVMEHIEEAGIHSGDSTCALPPYSLREEIVVDLMDQTITLAKALGVVGLMNVQYAVRQSRDPANLDHYDIFVLEANPRASRTVPFGAKATGVPVIKAATRLMTGEKIAQLKTEGVIHHRKFDHVAVKAPVFPFARFPKVDAVLGPEMKSTGEVMGIDRDFRRAFAKARLGTGSKLPLSGTVFISVRDPDKNLMIPLAAKLADMGFNIVATGGTARHLVEAGIRARKVNKVHEGQPHVIDAMINGDIALMLNTTDGPQAVVDDFNLRRAALHNKIHYYTTIPGAKAAVDTIAALRQSGPFDVKSLQEYLKAA
ncbi:MAG: carbamoyl-phosphate synthase large subunit [Alphaproteobacteria bacterium]|nr:carbamoyl-phosphate synthase large subunit [Alphaproteobacteria bacterium]